MLPLLAIQILLIAVSGGVAKPYCSWQEESQVCLETADTASPLEANAACADETYTQLVLDLKYCLTKQEPKFTGCIADTNRTRCEPSEYKLEERPISEHLKQGPPSKTGRLCLPSSLQAVGIPADALSQCPPAVELNREGVLRVLTAVNICEGRGEDRAKSTNESVTLTISAPCTCIGSNRVGPFNSSDGQLCSELNVLPDAQMQCEACINDWDTWMNDYLRKCDCRRTAWAAAPIQAFCRAAQTREACMKVNSDCGEQCGGVKTAGPGAMAASSTAPNQAEASASTEMSAAQAPSAGFPAAAAAAAATILFAARGL